jgi:hypothetical protein
MGPEKLARHGAGEGERGAGGESGEAGAPGSSKLFKFQANHDRNNRVPQTVSPKYAMTKPALLNLAKT